MRNLKIEKMPDNDLLRLTMLHAEKKPTITMAASYLTAALRPVPIYVVDAGETMLKISDKRFPRLPPLAVLMVRTVKP